MAAAFGIHHITMITRKVQENVDFYTGFLGLRLVKRTAGFEDAMQLHLFYGDAAGSPGSLLTFLVWEDGARGRVGHGQALDVSLGIPSAAIGFWLTRALTHGIRAEGPSQEFGEPVIRLRDPDGIVVKLVATAAFDTVAAAATSQTAGISPEYALTRIRGATLLSEAPDETLAFLVRHCGYGLESRSGAVRRMVSICGDILDVRDAAGFWSSAPGAGTVDHIAFRARDADDLNAARLSLLAEHTAASPIHDRKYFSSLYVREPGGLLIELATDGPGLGVDEDTASLGQMLFIPPLFMKDEEDVAVSLPQFSMPGEPRVAYRDLPFVHRFHTPDDPDGSVVALLHGTGGSEASLMPLARKANPRATLFGIRGRSTEEESVRWFRRFSDLVFDENDIVFEAAAFAAFLEAAIRNYGLDRDRLYFIGHSNGANFLAAFLALHPALAADALLFRPLPVLNEWPAADLSGRHMLLAAGETDRHRDKAADLRKLLADNGADAVLQTLSGGHELSLADMALARRWLAQRAAAAPA